VDPDVADTGQPYAYTGGDPVNEVDPLGDRYLEAIPGEQASSTPTGGVDYNGGCNLSASSNGPAPFPTVPISDSSNPVPILETPLVGIEASFNGTITGPNPLNLQVSPDGIYTSVGITGSIEATAGFSFSGDVTGALTDGTFTMGSDGLSDTLPAQHLDFDSDTLTYSITVTLYRTITPTEVYAGAGVVSATAITLLLIKGGSCAETIVDPDLAVLCGALP
jgi:hypothetical protein